MIRASRVAASCAAVMIAACGSGQPEKAAPVSFTDAGGDAGVEASSDATAPGPYDVDCPPRDGATAFLATVSAHDLMHDDRALYWAYDWGSLSEPTGAIERRTFAGESAIVESLPEATFVPVLHGGDLWFLSRSPGYSKSSLWRKQGAAPAERILTSTRDDPRDALTALASHGALWVGARKDLSKLVGSTLQRVTDVEAPVTAIAADDKRVYWLTVDGVHSAALGGGDLRDLFRATGSLSLWRLAIDATFAWFSYDGKLLRVPLAGAASAEVMATDVGDFRREGGEIYWASTKDNSVRRLRADLPDGEVVLSRAGERPIQEFVVAADQVFWVEGRPPTIDGGVQCLYRRALPPRMPGADAGGTDAGSTGATVPSMTTSYGSGGELRWALPASGAGNQELDAVDLFPSGDLAVTGTFVSATTFAGSTLTPTGKASALVARIDAAGKPAWVKAFGADFVLMTTLKVDAGSNVLLGGWFSGTMDLGAGPMTAGGADAFVAKLDGSGKALWSRRWVSSGYAGVSFVAPDAAGNVFVGGDAYGPGTIDFGDGPRTLSSTSGYVVKLDASGALLWARLLSSAARSGGVDATGSLTIGGGFSAPLTLGATTLTPVGTDVFVARLDAAGTWTSARRFGSPDHDFFGAAAVDPAGNLAFGGIFKDPIDFGGGPAAPCTKCRRAYIVELEGLGAPTFSRAFDTSAFSDSTSIRAMHLGPSLVVGGSFQDKEDFGGGFHDSAVTSGPGAGFLVKTSRAGKFEWSKSTARRGVVHGVVSDAGAVYAVGAHAGPLGLGTTLTTGSYSEYDGFLVKLAP